MLIGLLILMGIVIVKIDTMNQDNYFVQYVTQHAQVA